MLLNKMYNANNNFINVLFNFNFLFLYKNVNLIRTFTTFIWFYLFYVFTGCKVQSNNNYYFH